MMTWRDIPGYFDFQDLYSEAVNEAPQHGLFVEVGAWLGRSTAFLAAAILESGKALALDVVDTWQGSTGNDPTRQQALSHGGSVWPVFEANMIACGLLDAICPVHCDSVEAAKRYADASVDFVFIDADHEYGHANADIRAWWPKVKPGGMLAGHDYDMPGPRRAADAFAAELGLRLETKGRCFMLRKPI